MRKEDKGENYIKTYPYLKKWINECLCCHRKGYSPDLPDKISVVDGSLEVYFIKKYFKPLNINEQGLCAVCDKLLNNNS